MTRRSGLALRRAAMGYNQEALAKAVGAERRSVIRWEQRKTAPSPERQLKLAAVLKVTPETVAWWFSPDPPAEVPSGRSDANQLDQLHRDVQELDEKYDKVPSIALLAEAGIVLGQIAQAKRTASDRPTQARVRALEAEAETLMGQLVWDASQRRDHRRAGEHFDRAVEAARATGNPVVEGHALLRKSYLSLYGDCDPTEGLCLTQRAAHVTTNTSNVLPGLALLHTAEAHAMLGQVSECEHALGAAQARFAEVDDYDLAGFMFSSSQFDRVAGSCYLSLGQHARAQQTLEKTASTSGPKNKSRAIVLGNLSLARLRQGHLDGAAGALHEAIDVVEETRGGGGINLVFNAGRELRRWRTEPVVIGVYDRLLGLMATA
ncbi:helix-turn-helix transcriptional regulator [Kibdelosporangium lantanae]|uniref:Helix-turn-helix transcriptional regulator n=1 Tax=Kibdelosporangium lantanae TaxID=1497396 RepID=A0ABW3M1D0_9PSEU